MCSKVRTFGDSILEYGAKNLTHLVPQLQAELKASGDPFAAELLYLLDKPPSRRDLTTVTLDWIVQGVSGDDGLRMIAVRAGIDAELLSLGARALGNTYRIEDGKSSGGNFSWSRVGTHDMRHVAALCQRKGILSSCILYRVARKKDITVTMTTCAPSSYQVKLDFEQERQAARDELARRGFGETDPINQL